MAQHVGYWDNDIEYEEGPFVVVNAYGFRIECELKGYNMPVFPDISIYRLMKKKFRYEGKTDDLDFIDSVCNGLNEMVRNGEIVLDRNLWVVK